VKEPPWRLAIGVEEPAACGTPPARHPGHPAFSMRCRNSAALRASLFVSRDMRQKYPRHCATHPAPAEGSPGENAHLRVPVSAPEYRRKAFRLPAGCVLLRALVASRARFQRASGELALSSSARRFPEYVRAPPELRLIFHPDVRPRLARTPLAWRPGRRAVVVWILTSRGHSL